jgi:hypothetical protein
MNNKLKWQDNTEALVKKASKRLYIIRVLQRCGLPPNGLPQQITKMLSTSLNASALTTDAKSYVLKRSKRS